MLGLIFFSKSASTLVDQKKQVVQILSQHVIGACVFHFELGVGSRGEVPFIFSFLNIGEIAEVMKARAKLYVW